MPRENVEIFSHFAGGFVTKLLGILCLFLWDNGKFLEIEVVGEIGCLMGNTGVDVVEKFLGNGGRGLGRN